MALAAGILVAAADPAEEINWRSDYNSARREAQEKSLPLMLEFSTDNCFWCKKLDDSTFHDPNVSQVVNRRFVPLRVDAHKNAGLIDILHIQSFPTVVLAAPDGKILGTLEGYVEPARFHEQLDRALASIASPEWMTRDFEHAGRAIASADYARAVALLKSIAQEDKNYPVQAKSKQLLSDLEQQAAGRLTRAKQLEDQGQATEALDTLAELMRLYGGTQAATEGGQMLSALTAKPQIKALQRSRRARELLSQAREDYRTEQYLCCIDRCEVLISSYGDLNEGAEAMQLLTDIRNNPEWMRQACESLSERLGFMYISLAETWIKRGQPQQAVWCLERVMQSFPGSRQSEAAQTRLAQLQGQPTRRADFKKPARSE
jgi:thioredoxin-like negative regulator of GroEL